MPTPTPTPTGDTPTVEYDGCPCGTHGPCCATPSPSGGHAMFCDCDDDYCDYSWYLRCDVCGSECGCEI